MDGFIKISRYAGMREDLVQAGGGNSSFKMSSDKMVIKASGYQLAEMKKDDGYAIVNPCIIRNAFINNENLELVTEEESKLILKQAYVEGKRPSIETFLHAISGKYTLHTHPIVVNALTCRKGGMDILKGLFPEALFIPYATPGVELAKMFFQTYRMEGNGGTIIFDIVFLQNHGLVVSGDTAEEVIGRTEEVVKRLEQYLSCDYDDYHCLTKIWKCFEDKVVWRVTDAHILNIYNALNGMWQHTFCPDCVVFLGKKLLYLPDNFGERDVEEFCASYGSPVMINYNGYLFIIADSVKKAMEIQSVMSFSAQVMYLNRNEECISLTDEEQNFLLNWDAEKYRKTIR